MQEQLARLPARQRFPQGLPATDAERSKRIGPGQMLAEASGQAGPGQKLLNRPKWTVLSNAEYLLNCRVRQSGDHPQAEPQCRCWGARDVLQRTFPVTGIHIGGEHLDAMPLGIGDQLGRGVKAHGLAIQ